MEKDEPSYMAFARASVRDGLGVTSVIARELLARIDRQAEEIEELRNLTTRLH